MKAVLVEQYDAIDNIHIRDVEKPVVSDGQLLVRIQAVSLGFVDGLKVRVCTKPRTRYPSRWEWNLLALSRARQVM